jgi:hypothetical protein
MSPEQCRGAGQVAQRSDVYALGCVLFALLVGRPPFLAEGVGDIIAMHLREPAPVPSLMAPGIPPEVDALVAHCLTKDPALRLGSAGELAHAIGGLLGAVPQVSVGSPLARPASYAMPTTLSSVAGAMAGRAAPRSRSALVVAAVAALGVLGGGIWLASRGPSGEHRAGERAAAPPEPPAPAPAKPDLSALLAARMKAVLGQFSAWSSAHAGAPCPDVAALGGDGNDPWGRPFVLTCTGQPENQIVGLVSAGPDGVHGNDDDVASWQLGRDVTDRVRGARWVAPAPIPPPAPPPAPAAAPAVTVRPTAHRSTEPAKPRPAEPRPAATPPAKPNPRKGIQLDENGIPVDR